MRNDVHYECVTQRQSNFVFLQRIGFLSTNRRVCPQSIQVFNQWTRGQLQTRVGPPSVLRPPPSSLHRRTAMSEIPPEISTGHLLLRGLIPSFVGCAIGDDGSGVGAVRASAFQMTFRKELPQLGRAGGELLPPGSRCVLSRCILMCLCDVWAQLSVLLCVRVTV